MLSQQLSSLSLLSQRGLACLLATGLSAWIVSAHAANVTPQVLIHFDGSLAGTDYTLGPGELDTTSTFRSNGMAMAGGGIGDIPGDVDDSSGFYFDGSVIGNLSALNWISEARFSPDVSVPDQPNGAQPYNHFLDVQGDTFFRFNGDGNDPKITQFGYWDGGSEPIVNVPDLPAGQFSHVALVWDATATQLEAFVNGVSQGVADANAFEQPSNLVGYGFFARFLNRAVDGKFDSVAFSTFEGTFDSQQDFQLPVPEPSTIMLLLIFVAGLPWIVRRK